MARWQVYPPEPRDHGVRIFWLRILDDQGVETLVQMRESPSRPWANPSPVIRGEARFQAWRAEREAAGDPQTDGGRMKANDPDYNG